MEERERKRWWWLIRPRSRGCGGAASCGCRLSAAYAWRGLSTLLYHLLQPGYSSICLFNDNLQLANVGVCRSKDMPGSISSLDSSLSSSDPWDDEERLLQQEWEESMEDLQRLFTFVLMPFLGKWLGRRWSHWGACYTRCLNIALSRSYVQIISIRPLHQARPRKVVLLGRESIHLRRHTSLKHNTSINIIYFAK